MRFFSPALASGHDVHEDALTLNDDHFNLTLAKLHRMVAATRKGPGAFIGAKSAVRWIVRIDHGPAENRR